MNEITVTVIGNVATDARHVVSKHGTSIATFRLANTPRRLERGQWLDGATSFMTVTCWRGLADHVMSSLQKGEPVIVVGRLRVNDWKNEGRSGRDVEIDAITVGHDLTRGVSAFRKAPKEQRTTDDDHSAAQELRDELRADAFYDDEPVSSDGTQGGADLPDQPNHSPFAA